MRFLISALAVISLLACNAQTIKISEKQEKLEAFIKKYQDSIAAEPDIQGKEKMALNMWARNVKFIQDTLKVSYNTVDTFIFDKAIVREFDNPNDNNRYLHILLDKGFYQAEFFVRGEKPEYLFTFPIYRMAKRLKQDAPVKAIGNLQIMSLVPSALKDGTNKVTLDFRVDSLVSL